VNPFLHTFAVDLSATDSAVARRALAGDPILIYPKGTHHRYDPWAGETRTWTVDDTVVAQLVDNYAHRTERGIRQARLPINEDHQSSRALGWYKDLMALPEGLGATFLWNRKGHEALENGEFSYFSVEIYDELIDHVTGDTIHNQIAGGALTNYPFFGEATSLMSRLATGGIPMDETLEQLQAERNWLQNLFANLFGRAPASGGAPPADLHVSIPEDLRQEMSTLREQVQQFTTQLQTAVGERDSYAQRVQALEGQLTVVQDARAVERFAVLAESFAHLPAATADLAGHLRWLHEADAEGAHRDFFTQLLRRADEQFGVYFHEFGVQRGTPGSATTQLETLAQQYQASHPGIGYRDALSAVLAEHPDMERAYNREGGAQ